MLFRAIAGSTKNPLFLLYTPSSRRLFHKSPATMVEGHQCHRVGHFHRLKLLGKPFQATSPNGRFSEGAQAINNKPLTRIEIHGKNLFYFFGNHDVVRIHFGMSGAFSTFTSSTAPPPKPTTRLELTNTQHDLVCHLSAMTVQHGSLDLYNSSIASLGEDPLREDADVEAAWHKVSKSKKPIGLLLMDQSVIAGVGNIYRAEILFKSGVHPDQPGSTISRPAFDTIWYHCVDLLKRGFQSGSILTVDPEDAIKLGKPWTRRYIYNQARCGRCGDRIQTWDMAARTVYACVTCQPMVGGGRTVDDTEGMGAMVASEQKGAHGTARDAVLFVSHCAPDRSDGEEESMAGAENEAVLVKLTVGSLKKKLVARGLSTRGKKAELIARLVERKEEKKEGDDGVELVMTPDKKERKKRKRKDEHQNDADAAAVYPEVYNWGQDEKSNSNGRVAAKPGTKEIKYVATAKEAAMEKIVAREKKSVEHVALNDDC